MKEQAQPTGLFGIPREDIWRNRREAKAYLHKLVTPAPATQRVLIFAQGRTGSTVLENLLSSTGYFSERGELLGANNERVRFPAAYLIGRARAERWRNFLCHVKIYHLDRDRTNAGARPVSPHEFLHHLAQDDWTIIYLRRTNKFEQYLSGCMARARGAYHKFDNSQDELQITIDRNDLERGILRRRGLDKEEAQALAGIAHIPIVYERDLKSQDCQQATVDRIMDHLGLERRPISTSLKKIASRPMAEMIKNYADAAKWAQAMGEEM